MFDTLTAASRPASRASLSPDAAAKLCAVLSAHGAHLMHQIVRAVAGALPASRVRRGTRPFRAARPLLL